jgi:hypothetical protein
LFYISRGLPRPTQGSSSCSISPEQALGISSGAHLTGTKMHVSLLSNLQTLLLLFSSIVQASDNFTTLTDAFPLLAGLDSPPSRMSPRLGGQNFTQCCLKAFSQSLTIINGSVVARSEGYVLSDDGKAVDIDNLLTSQFPCRATYQGDRTGVNQVKVPWSWCHDNCGGFEISQSTKLNQWIQPFVGFLLPSVIFCLSVPRRRKIRLPNWVFPRNIDNVRVIWAFCCAVVAVILVSIDTIIWLGTVFALAGPLLLSGVYEAIIDKRVVDFMTEKIRNQRLPLALRARILFAVLVGNLDPESAWNPSMELANCLERATATSNQRNPSIVLNNPGETAVPTAPTNQLPAATTLACSRASSAYHSERVSQPQLDSNDITAAGGLSILKFKTRLKSMLACQYSFGSTVGAPVIFYIGSFIFTVLEINATLGDNDTANALAFGMWWMSIPHTSIVSGCLLAGNNPNTLEAIAPNAGHADGPSQLLDPKRIWNSLSRPFIEAKTRLTEPTYEAQYIPAPMWERGRSKREWALKLSEDYHDLVPNDMDELRERLSMKWGDWVMLSVFAFALFFVPCLLGLLTAYYTPQVGLACRSLTFMVYACSQMLLLLLWIWNLTWRDSSWRRRRDEDRARNRNSVTNGSEVVEDERPPTDIEGQNTSTRKFILFEKIMSATRYPRSNPANVTNNTPTATSPSLTSQIGSSIFWFLMIIGLISAIFSAIGGTMMQIIGVYRNCLCKISAQHWLDKDMTLFLSSNNKIDIVEALHWWRTTGAVATGFLGVICYIGWWYQRRLRFRFRILVHLLDHNLPASP